MHSPNRPPPCKYQRALSLNRILLPLVCFCKLSTNRKDPVKFLSAEQTSLHCSSCQTFLNTQSSSWLWHRYSSTNAGCTLQLWRRSNVNCCILWAGGFQINTVCFFFNRSQAYGLWKRSRFQPQAVHWRRWALSHSALTFCLRLKWWFYKFFANNTGIVF